MFASWLGVFAIGIRVSDTRAAVASRLDSPQQAYAAVPIAWPGAGRFLAAPMVAGGDVMGRGAVRIQNGVVTSETSNFDDAPPEMSLRTFAWVDHGSTGFSAVFRFVHPIVQLHAWRRIDVRHTITVVLTAPDGVVHAVELQADGTTAFGNVTGGVLTPTGASTSAIAGNVAVVDVPASLGVTSEWTVQGLIKVESDQRLHPNNSINFDTGYLAGTSVVPVGLLTGAAGATLPTTPIVDALTTLMGAAAPPRVAPTPSMRPTEVRFEGQGTTLVLVVSLAAPPFGILANRDALEIDLVEPGINSITSPTQIIWFPSQPGEPTADAFIGDANYVGSIPVTVRGNEVSFALGAATMTPRPATPSSSGELPMDHYTGPINLVVSRDETVSSADGEARFVFAETAAEQPTYPAPAKAVDAAVVNLNGPAITITRASTGVTATGFIDSNGTFFATSPSDYYSGLIDAHGDASFYDASLAAGPDGEVTLAPVQVDRDYTAVAVAAALTVPVLIGQTSMKGDLSNPPALLTFSPPPSATRPWTERLTKAAGSPASANQPGIGDWPLTAITSTASEGFVGPNGPFAIRVFSTASADGPVAEIGGPWLSSTAIPALATPARTVDTTVPPIVAATASSAAPSSSAASSRATVSVVPSAAATPPARISSTDESSATPWIALVVVALAAGSAAAVLVSRRRRRRGPPRAAPAPPAPQIRSVIGTVHSAASPSDDGHELGLQSARGTPIYRAQESHEADEPMGTR